ncbi:uncharacterized protein LOC143856718 [Tasmannia lanceolata]|uniref:uncharacterized protein LOC143856718 n=1 Tax=Tasmannia lanceolata TaxID=3420 RepID=UPI00406290D3
MTLVGSREVKEGPTVYVGKGQQEKEGVVIKGVSCSSAHLERELVGRDGFCLDCSESTVESSSISVGGESSCKSTAEIDREEEDDVQSEFKGGLVSMGSLEESLPIKSGLSNFFAGKSKSFANLAEVTCVKDLVKAENPFNKRRRILMAAKSSRTTPYNTLNTYLPLIGPDSLEETQEEEEEEEEEEH